MGEGGRARLQQDDDGMEVLFVLTQCCFVADTVRDVIFFCVSVCVAIFCL